ncbi:MAG: hypothetical protein R2849_23350 [Thermomicrobiales bacterium]
MNTGRNASARQNSHPDGFSPEIIIERVGSTSYIDQVTNGRPGDR